MNEHMTRLLALLAIVLGVFASTASARVTGDPRVCSLHSATACGRQAASTALERVLAVRDHQPSWGGETNCTGNPGKLRWRCTFHSAIDKGSAIVTFAKAPTWKPTVKLVSYAAQ